MNISKAKKILIGYSITSTLLTFYHLLQLYEESANFYVLGTLLSYNGLTLFICTNFIISWTLIIGTILQNIIFGELRLIELEHLYERSWRSIVSLLITGFTQLSHENSLFLIFLGSSLLFLKVFHCIISDRLDGLIQRYHSPNGENNEYSGKLNKIIFNRIIVTLIIFIRIDYIVMKWCIDESFTNNRYVLLGISFELFFEIMQLLNSIVKFLCNIYEIKYLIRNPDEDKWWLKIWIETIFKFLSDIITSIAIMLMFTIFLFIGVFLFQLLTTSFYSFYDTVQSGKKIVLLIKNQMRIKSILLTPTTEEIKQAEICIICRDDLDYENIESTNLKPKKLICGHILHDSCIRSWLNMSTLCPTCRKDVTKIDKNANNNNNVNNNVVPIADVNDNVVNEENQIRNIGNEENQIEDERLNEDLNLDTREEDYFQVDNYLNNHEDLPNGDMQNEELPNGDMQNEELPNVVNNGRRGTSILNRWRRNLNYFIREDRNEGNNEGCVRLRLSPHNEVPEGWTVVPLTEENGIYYATEDVIIEKKSQQ